LQREILDGSYARDADRLMEYTARFGEIQEDLRWEIQWRYDEVKGRYREVQRRYEKIWRKSWEIGTRYEKIWKRSGKALEEIQGDPWRYKEI
jgi:hypothetical protein